MMENTGEDAPQIDNQELYRHFGEKLTKDLFEGGYIKVTQEDGEKLEEMSLFLEDNENAFLVDINEKCLYVSVFSEDDEIEQFMMDYQGIYQQALDEDEKKLTYKLLDPESQKRFLERLMRTDADPAMTANWNTPSDLEKQGAIYYRVNVHDTLPFPLPFPVNSKQIV